MIIALSVLFSQAPLDSASSVIDRGEFETLVSRQQTICEYRLAKPKRKNNNKPGYTGKTTDGCKSPVMDVIGTGGDVEREKIRVKKMERKEREMGGS